MITPTFDMKKAFFDREKIKKAVDRASRKAISKSLAYIRTSQRSSLRRRKKVSRPGQTPSIHSTNPNASLKKILFAYDERTKSGVVGPVLLNSSKARMRLNKPLPAVLEAGGTLTLKEESYDGKTWRQTPMRRRRKPTRGGMKTRTRRVNIAPRPSAGPALERETSKGNILSPWANVVTG
tara:strand:+ start:1073 stop:1612 length:540 start_codon:yes stop_codon:yes gene_type:complete